MLLNSTSLPLINGLSFPSRSRGLSSGFSDLFSFIGSSDKPRGIGNKMTKNVNYKNTVIFFIFLLFLIFSTPTFSWCATGHKLIGQIAYDHLTPQARRYYAHLNQNLNQQQHYYTLVAAAVWMDTLFDRHYLAFKPMHYIDIPESPDGTPFPKMAAMNAVVAIQQAMGTLKDGTTTEEEKAIALRIILHVVGDVHQPLHTVTRVTRDHPKGDRGGNDFHLGRNKVGNTLHRYWDRGGGYLSSKLSDAEIRQLAKQLETKWACPTPDLELMHWVQASHTLAVQHAYAIQENTCPTVEYEQQTQRDTQQQLVFAGCRLAQLLNNLIS